MKDNVRLSNESIASESRIYDELGRLNNELANLQRELTKKNILLEKLNEEKNRFLGIAAHDLRNPLNAIQMYSEFLLDEAAGAFDEDQMGFVSIIHDSSQFMLQLVNDLLDVAKIESGKLDLTLAPIDLVSVIESNLKPNAALAARKNIQVNFDSTIDSLFVDADKAKIEQAIDNLISNAVKYSQPGSSVLVKAMKSGDKAVISVEDQGQGIPHDELDRLFRPFEKTSVKSTGGEESTGLGLAIVQKIIQGHSGSISVKSEIGKGTCFTIEFPIMNDRVQ